MTTEPQQQSTALTLIGKQKPLTPADVFKKNGASDILKFIKDEVTALAPSLDVNTKAGRDLIRSTAADIRSAKARLDEMGADLKKQYSVLIEPIDAERRRIKEELEALAVVTRQPLTDFDAKEEARVEGHKTRLAQLEAAAQFLEANPPSAVVQARIDGLAAYAGVDWQEFVDAAGVALPKVQASLAETLTRVQKYENDQAELARLRAVENERLQREAEEQRLQRLRDQAAADVRRQNEAAERAEQAFNTAYIQAIEDNAAFDRRKTAEALQRQEAASRLVQEQATQATAQAAQVTVKAQAAEASTAQLQRYVTAAEAIISAMIGIVRALEAGKPMEYESQKAIMEQADNYVSCKELYF